MIKSGWLNRSQLRLVIVWLITFSVGLIGGLVCVALNTPLPWMIGPLLFTATGRLLGLHLLTPGGTRSAGQWVIGTALGLYFTPVVVSELLQLAVPVIIGAAFALFLGAASGWLLSRVSGMDKATCYFSAMPGGASEMTNLAEKYRARVDLVAAAHSLRIMLVVIIMPAIFVTLDLHGQDNTQFFSQTLHLSTVCFVMLATLPAIVFWKWLRQPNPWVIGSLIVTALLTAFNVTSGTLPSEIVAAGQVFIGCSLGCRFSPDFFRGSPRFLLAVSTTTLFMLLMAAVFGILLAWLSGLSIPAVVLGLSPGGISEMCITAKVLHLAVPVVTSFHVIRMLGVVMLSDVVYARFIR